MSKNNILVIAPHPDDETLGCGGTLLKHKAEGDEIFWLIITNVSEENGFIPDRVESRQEEIESVSRAYNFTKHYKLDLPTAQLDKVPQAQLINNISNVINEVKPDIVYLPFGYDVHTDHQIVFKAAYACTKNFRYPFIKEIRLYETISETDFAPALPGQTFVPNIYNNITDFIDQKCSIMEIYHSELMPDHLPRSISSIRALSRLRGSRVGQEYSEAFQSLLRIL